MLTTFPAACVVSPARQPRTARRAPVPRIVPYGRGFTVEGVAMIQAAPYRTPEDAAEFARRIVMDPEGYLSAMAELEMVGIVDIRPL